MRVSPLGTGSSSSSSLACAPSAASGGEGTTAPSEGSGGEGTTAPSGGPGGEGRGTVTAFRALLAGASSITSRRIWTAAANSLRWIFRAARRRSASQRSSSVGTRTDSAALTLPGNGTENTGTQRQPRTRSAQRLPALTWPVTLLQARPARGDLSDIRSTLVLPSTIVLPSYGRSIRLPAGPLSPGGPRSYPTSRPGGHRWASAGAGPSPPGPSPARRPVGSRSICLLKARPLSSDARGSRACCGILGPGPPR